MTIITDGCSPVAGFEASAEQFLKDMKVLGLRLRTTQRFFSRFVTQGGWVGGSGRTPPANPTRGVGSRVL